MKIPIRLTAFGAALIVLTVGAAPLLSSAADHIDASAFGSLGTPGGAFDPMSVHGERDINDVYAFQGSNASRTVLAMTTNPAINAFGGKFGPNVRYIINVDRDGNAVQDLAYVVRFDNGDRGNQKYTVTRYTGAQCRSRSGSATCAAPARPAGNGMASLLGNGKIFAGVRSDPFFFDLTGFVGTLFHIGTDALGDNPTDIFTGFNTNAIVIEVPDDQLGRQDRRLGPDPVVERQRVDARRPDGPAGHQHGVQHQARRPERGDDQEPVQPRRHRRKQRTADGGQFRTNVITTLTHINAALGTGHADDTWPRHRVSPTSCCRTCSRTTRRQRPAVSMAAP